AYQARGTLASVSDGEGTTSYDFDALGRLVGYDGQVAYSYDGVDRLASRDTTALSYAGAGLDPVSDGSMDYARSPDGSLLAVSDGTTALLSGLSRHGDLAYLFDDTGEVATTRVYDPYGTMAGQTGTLQPAVGFQGDYTDPVSSDVWMGARWYDPAAGGFLSRDTVFGQLSTPVSLNRYTYAFADPMSYFDPDGRWPKIISKVVKRVKQAVDDGLAVGRELLAVDSARTALLGAVSIQKTAMSTTLGLARASLALSPAGMVRAAAETARDVRTKGPRSVVKKAVAKVRQLNPITALQRSLGDYADAYYAGDYDRMARVGPRVALDTGSVIATVGALPGLARGAVSRLPKSGVPTARGGAMPRPQAAPNTAGARFVAGSDGVITDLGPRVAPGRPVVIGENMPGRVMPDAQRMGADFYSPPRIDNPAQSMAHNRYWINEQMNQGRGMIDVGPAPGRAGFPEPTSPWYAMERAQIAERGYPWYVQRQQF
ncbi:MAG: RHS repeat-associated core domain-containing protein, partial [Candidatus Limnocylindria bacterium]